MENKITILVLSGSIREKSYTRSLVSAISDNLKSKGINAIHWDLLEKPLPIMGPAERSDLSTHANHNVRELAKLALEADAFVWGSPIYHNSYSGVLKNTLDFLGSKYFDYKPVGLASHGGNGSTQAVDHLRIVARSVGAITILTNICTGKDAYSDGDDEQYSLTSESTKSRINRFNDELIEFSNVFAALRKSRQTKIK